MTSKQLRSSILQAAIQGQLVPQVPSDTPAALLLERIQAEQERLIEEKKIRRDKNASVIYRTDEGYYYERILASGEETCIDDEIPFDIPDSWQWTRVGTVSNIWSARRVHEKDWRTSGVPFYRAREISKIADCGYVNNDLFISQSLYDEFSKSGVPQTGDLMMTAVGTLGKSYVVKTTAPFYYKDGSVLCVGNCFGLNPYYLKLFFDSPAFATQYLSDSDGTTVSTLTMVRLKRYFIPIPPLEEQERIVARIEELMRYTDRLKSFTTPD